jgi:hypothetical protein
MWISTTFDYESDAVTDVYGPFNSKREAIDAVRSMARSEFEVLQKAWDDAELTDTLEDDASLEITFDDPNDNGCFYQVLELKKP